MKGRKELSRACAEARAGSPGQDAFPNPRSASSRAAQLDWSNARDRFLFPNGTVDWGIRPSSPSPTSAHCRWMEDK